MKKVRATLKILGNKTSERIRTRQSLAVGQMYEGLPIVATGMEGDDLVVHARCDDCAHGHVREDQGEFWS